MQEKSHSISMSVIRRLPRYYRFLGELEREGKEKISSRELSEKMRLTASQIRQDLNCFGGFGMQGYGYNVSELRGEIGEILHLNNEHTAILIGAGNLGRAVTVHLNFNSCGFRLVGIFDRESALVGSSISGLRVLASSELVSFCNEHRPSMAILCIPRDSAPEVVKTLMESGVTAFWNFSHYDILGDFPEALVENVHLNDSLMALSYRLENRS